MRILLLLVFISAQLIHTNIKAAQTIEPKISLASLITEDTESVLLINNMTEFYTQLEKNPLNKLWDNKKIRKRFASSIRTLEQPRWELYSKRIFGRSIKQLIDLFAGQLVLLIPEFSTTTSLALMADIGTNQLQIKDVLNKQMQYQIKHLGEGEQYIEENENFLSFATHSRYLLNEDSKKEHFSWALSGQYLLVAKSKQVLQNLLVNMQKKNRDNSWTQTSSYQNIKRSQPELDWMFYINNTPIIDLLNNKLAPIKEMAGQDSQQFIDLLNNTGLKSLYLVGKKQHDKILLDMSIFYQDSSWLMGLLKHQNSPLNWPVFLQDNALSASTSSMNIGKIWKNILMLPEQSPIFATFIPLIQTQLQVYSKSSGVNLEDTLTDGFGQQIYIVDYPLSETQASNQPEDKKDKSEASSLYVISLQDQQAVEMAINGLKKSFFLAELFKNKQYLDTSIHFYNPSNQKNIHQANDLMVYAIRDNLLLYSNNLNTMEAAIEQIHNKNDKKALHKLPQLQKIMAQLPENATDVSYYQGAYFVKAMVDGLVTFQDLAIASENQYSCNNQKNETLNSSENIESPSESLQLYQGYLDDVFISQHQSDNYYRIHAHFNLQ